MTHAYTAVPGSFTSTGEYRSLSSPKPSRPKDPRPQMKMRPSSVSASVCVPPHAACTTLPARPDSKFIQSKCTMILILARLTPVCGQRHQLCCCPDGRWILRPSQCSYRRLQWQQAAPVVGHALDPHGPQFARARPITKTQPAVFAATPHVHGCSDSRLQSGRVPALRAV